MMDLIKFDLTVFFEAKDSDFYGGEGSVGYTSAKFESCELKKILEIFTSEEKTAEYLTGQREMVAKMLFVPVEKVRVISEKEYKENTAETKLDDDE